MMVSKQALASSSALFLPDELKARRIWEPQANAAEQKHKERMQALWGKERF